MFLKEIIFLKKKINKNRYHQSLDRESNILNPANVLLGLTRGQTARKVFLSPLALTLPVSGLSFMSIKICSVLFCTERVKHGI